MVRSLRLICPRRTVTEPSGRLRGFLHTAGFLPFVAARTLARLMARRVALVHDFLLDLRGAERVFAAMCETWPDADVFTAVYDEDGTEGRFAARHPQTSFLQRVRPTSRTFRPLLPLYPHAVESFDLRGYDTVISSSSAWAHGVLVDPGRGARLLLPQPVPVRVDGARGDAAGAPPARPAGAARAAQPLADVGLDRRPAGRPLRRELAADRGAHPALLRARLDRPVPAGRHRSLPPGRSGVRSLHGAGGADGPQADRRRGPGVQRARRCRSSSSATGRRCVGCGGSRVRPSRSPGG